MPLCPQITNTPITVVLNADFTVTNVIPVLPATNTQVNTALADAQAAQTAAAAALVQAGIAFTAAQNSLQPSANTIVNASNQMTAINGTGITVFSGASATSGARVVLNSVGLAGFNAAGTATFSVSASTGAAVFSGSVTGATITASTMNIGGNAIIDASGFLTATGANIIGTITATSGSFTGEINATSGTIGGLTLASNSIFSVTGGFSVTSAGVLTASSGTVGGFELSASSIFAGTSLVISTTGTITGGNSSTLFYGFANIGGGTAGAERLIVTGNSSFDGTIVTTGAATINGELRAVFGRNNSVSSAVNVFISTTGQIRHTTASSARYKENITDLRDVPELDPKKLLAIPVRAFSYRDDYLVASDDRAGILIPGLIAEEVDAIYPLAADYSDGEVENINDRAILVNLLALVQDLYKEIEILKGE